MTSTKNQERDDDGMFDRRAVLMQGAIVAAAATLASDAHGQDSGSHAVASQNVNMENLPKSEGVRDYDELVRRLNEFSSLQGSNDAAIGGDASKSPISRPIDTGALNLLSPITGARFKYPPFQVEYLIGTLSDHINNCIQIRYQAQELEIQALQSRISLALDEKLNSVSQVQSEFNLKNGHRVLSSMVDASFQASSGRVIGQGYEPGNDQNHFVLQNTIDQAVLAARNEEIESRKRIIEQTGGGSNHVDRFEFLKDLFDVELAEAYRRAVSASAGLEYAYGLDLPVPDLIDVGYLDLLALWTRKAVYALEQQNLSRTLSTITLPLRDQLGSNRSELDLPALMSDDQFKKSRAGGIFEFTISSEMLNSPLLDLKDKNPLLRSVRLALYRTSSGGDPNTQLANLLNADATAATITMEEQVLNPKSGGNAKLYQYTPVLRAGLLTGGSPQAAPNVEDEATHNLRIEGKWQVRFGQTGIRGGNFNEDSNLSNIVLFLTIAHDI